MNSIPINGNPFLFMIKYSYHLLFALLVQILIFYIYSYNVVTLYVFSLLFALLVSQSTKLTDKFPIINFWVTFFLLLFVNSKITVDIVEWIESFYSPSILWTIIATLSFPFGIASGIGRFSSWRYKRMLENYSNLILLILMVIVFVFQWWEGGLAYFIVRLPIMTFEIKLTHTLMRPKDLRDNEINNDVAPL